MPVATNQGLTGEASFEEEANSSAGALSEGAGWFSNSLLSVACFLSLPFSGNEATSYFASSSFYLRSSNQELQTLANNNHFIGHNVRYVP